MKTAAAVAALLAAVSLALPGASRAADVDSAGPGVGGEFVHSESAPEVLERVACPAPAGRSSVDTVIVQALVGKDGRVRDCKVVKSVPGLDETAVACVRQYLFEPLPSNGKAATVWIAVPVRFGAAEAVPVAISKVPPTYPQAARDGRIEGMVVVRALVDREGRVARCQVKVSVPGLDEAAVEAVSQWRFRPAKLYRFPVAMWLDVPIRFSLR